MESTGAETSREVLTGIHRSEQDVDLNHRGSEKREGKWEPQMAQRASEMRQQAALYSYVVCMGQTISVLRRKTLPDLLWGTDQFYRISSFDLTSELLLLLQGIPSLCSQLLFCIGFHCVLHEWLQLLPKWLQSYDSLLQSMHLVLILVSYSWYCDNFNMNVVYLNNWLSSLTKYLLILICHQIPLY